MTTLAEALQREAGEILEDAAQRELLRNEDPHRRARFFEVEAGAVARWMENPQGEFVIEQLIATDRLPKFLDGVVEIDDAELLERFLTEEPVTMQDGMLLELRKPNLHPPSHLEYVQMAVIAGETDAA